MRDLEDFARLHLRVLGISKNVAKPSYQFRFENIISETEPEINLFEAVDETTHYLDGGDSHDDFAYANKQLEKIKLVTVSKIEDGIASGIVQLDRPTYLLFEGKYEGVGDLAFVLRVNGKEIYKTTVKLTLRDISKFYRTWKVNALDNDTVQVPSTVQDVPQTEYKPKTDDIVLYVHGWNMQDFEKKRWTETLFKRLWWQGYKGHVVNLDWPTLCFTSIVPPPDNYDRSEYRAYQSGQYLEMLLEWLDTTKHRRKVNILAHSMGNIVASEALRQLPPGIQVNAYVASQAAVSAQAYDVTMPNNDNNTAHFTLPGSGPKTPEIIRHYFSGIEPNVPYYAGNSEKAYTMYRYFNRDDWALDLWETNNYMKPDNSYDFANNDGNVALYTEGIDRFYQTYISGTDLLGNPVYSERILHIDNTIERYEIFAFCAESRARALGAVVDPIADFKQFDLRTRILGYKNDHYSHSRQFRSNIISEWPYWVQFVGNCEFNK